MKAPTIPPNASTGELLEILVDVMDRLLSPGGCPWDQEQTLDTLKPFLIEECYEVIDAIEQGTAEEHCEELGDLLFQIVFQSALRKRTQDFDLGDTIRSISEKLIRRHPHVFAEATVSDSDEVLTQWEAIKAQEKSGRTSLMDSVPASMPALSRAEKLSKKAAKVGFDWPDAASSLLKVKEEIAEVEDALKKGATEEAQTELGDLLFAVVNLARKLDCDPEEQLRHAGRKFEARFRHMETEAATELKALSLDELEVLWAGAKTSGL